MSEASMEIDPRGLEETASSLASRECT
ncbi:Protein of unknown function [Pyronema omphalodes CBS 100304]|uniref:Uncharacterized protein n=1 Tax=Pyronema omphalodes (strain CBS 100304) TaxID=1076935 RepID=U4LQ24_PYROM|nr:Protein of unknown function [Pyronema omphalodes CBS 100304]